MVYFCVRNFSMLQVLNAVQYLHSIGITHRDLKVRGCVHVQHWWAEARVCVQRVGKSMNLCTA
jgi:serine/threonine protein kinase